MRNRVRLTVLNYDTNINSPPFSSLLSSNHQANGCMRKKSVFCLCQMVKDGPVPGDFSASFHPVPIMGNTFSKYNFFKALLALWYGRSTLENIKIFLLPKGNYTNLSLTSTSGNCSPKVLGVPEASWFSLFQQCSRSLLADFTLSHAHSFCSLAFVDQGSREFLGLLVRNFVVRRA